MELENTDAFRRDLFHRINVLRLELPPLRERGDDIEGLTNWLVKRVAGRLGVEPKALSDEAYNALSDYNWPGNVRELEHTIERALVMADGNVIAMSDLNLPIMPPLYQHLVVHLRRSQNLKLLNRESRVKSRLRNCRSKITSSVLF